MKKNLFGRLIIIIFVIFLSVYLNGNQGNINKQRELTEKQIMKFENDLSNNVPIDLNEYLPPKKDHSNFFSKCAYKISQKSSYLMNVVNTFGPQLKLYLFLSYIV